MIKGMRITGTESKAYMHTEELKKYLHININYDFALEPPHIVKSKTGGEDIITVEYKLSIVYTNPSMGYLRYQGEVDCLNTEENAKNLSEEQRNEIANTVMLNILPLALLLSRSMGLPPAVPLPLPPKRNFNKQQQQQDDKKGYG